MFNFLARVIPALQAGKELKNVEVWKNLSATINLLSVILGLIVAGIRLQYPDFVVSDEVLLKFATGLATILGGANGFMHIATSKKVGIK